VIYTLFWLLRIFLPNEFVRLCAHDFKAAAELKAMDFDQLTAAFRTTADKDAGGILTS